MYKKKLFYCLIILFCAFTLITGCNNAADSFSPYTTLENDYVVNCMVDTRNKSNIVSIQRIYTKINPTVLSGKTTAFLSDENGEQIILRDTVIGGSNKTNFIIPSDCLSRGTNYRLTVNNEELGLRWGYFKMFPFPELSYKVAIYKREVLDNWEVTISFKKNIDVAYLMRVYIIYELLEDGIWKRGTVEVPVSLEVDKKAYNPYWVLIDHDFKDLSPGYPVMQLTENLSDDIVLVDGKYSVVYDGWFTYSALKLIGRGRLPGTVKIKGMFAVLNQVDNNYYRNFIAYSRANTSVRLDQQLTISNVQKDGAAGYGLISSATADTIFFPAFFAYVGKLQYIDEQNYSN